MSKPIVIEYKNYTLLIRRPNVRIDLRMGTQGPPGLPGAPGGQFIQMLAGQNLSAGRAVVSIGNLAYYFQPSDLTLARGIVGVTRTAALSGGLVDIQIAGEFSDPGLSLTPDQGVFVAANGVLTTTPPISGLVLIAGLSLTPTSLILRPSFTINKI